MVALPARTRAGRHGFPGARDAAIRLALQSKADRQDMSEVMVRLDEVLDRLPHSEHTATGQAAPVGDG